jgi:hypothetical protein
MRYNKTVNKPSKAKKTSIMILTSTAIAIISSGVFFAIYSFVNNISFKVLNTNVSGIIFGVVVIYLGIRYLMSISKLKKALFQTNSTFSWSNFKKQKVA